MNSKLPLRTSLNLSLAVLSMLVSACNSNNNYRAPEPAKAYCKLNDGYYVSSDSEQSLPMFAIKTRGEKQTLWLINENDGQNTLSISERPQNYDCSFTGTGEKETYRVIPDGQMATLERETEDKNTSIGTFQQVTANNMVVRAIFQLNMNILVGAVPNADQKSRKSNYIKFLTEVFEIDRKFIDDETGAKIQISEDTPSATSAAAGSSDSPLIGKFRQSLAGTPITKPANLLQSTTNSVAELEKNKSISIDTTEFVNTMRTAVKAELGNEYVEANWAPIFQEQTQGAITEARKSLSQSLAIFVDPYFKMADEGYLLGSNAPFKQTLDYYKNNYSADLSETMLMISGSDLQGGLTGANGLYLMESLDDRITFKMTLNVIKSGVQKTLKFPAKIIIKNISHALPLTKKKLFGAKQIIFLNQANQATSLDDVHITLAHELRHVLDFSMTNKITNEADKAKIKVICESRWPEELESSLQSSYTNNFIKKVDQLITDRFSDAPAPKKFELRNSFFRGYEMQLKELFVEDCLYYYSDYEHRAFYESVQYARQSFGKLKAEQAQWYYMSRVREIKSDIASDTLIANVVHTLKFYYSVLLQCTDSLKPPFKRVCL
jgi:hypothetical protein